jgi:hypothetical protein
MMRASSGHSYIVEFITELLINLAQKVTSQCTVKTDYTNMHK